MLFWHLASVSLFGKFCFAPLDNSPTIACEAKTKISSKIVHAGGGWKFKIQNELDG